MHAQDHRLIFSHYYARGIKSANVPKVVTFQSFHKLDVNLLSDILSDDSSWNDVFSFQMLMIASCALPWFLGTS